MLACERLSVALVAAIAACAVARPDDSTGFYMKRSYGTVDLHSAPVKGSRTVNVNAVQKLETPGTPPVNRDDNNVVQSGPLQPTKSAAGPSKPPSNPAPINPSPFNPSPGVKPEGRPVASTAELKVVPEGFRDDSRPVNKRFPHAVLFGGTCGGSIIHPKWILTAGHCTLFTGGRYVLAGTNNSDDGSGITKKVKKLHVHPLFSVGPYWLNAKNFDIKQVAARYDFMLAELEEPFVLDGVTIGAVPLDSNSVHQPDTFVGYAGYGTDHHGGYMRSEMHAMNLKIRSDEECASLEQFNSDDMLCAKGYTPNFDSACNGDSGSGLVDGEKLVGVTSWVQNDAFECAKGNLVVFSKVATAREWINKVSGV